MNIFSRKEEPCQKMPTKKEEPSGESQRIHSKKEESTQGNQGDVAVDAANAPGTPGQPEHLHSLGSSSVLKSGPLFLSSKGIGWTSWKKRWFVLTTTSLVFYRSDPSAIAQKGSEVNLTLGGIDLNNSGSVDVKADKKLITVLFPDGRDGRAFTLKAETLEDLNDWKAAFETALSQAPSSADAVGQNGIGNDQVDADDGSKEPEDDQQPVKSAILQTPILHALERADGNPTFLEKALRFVEEHGGEVEGILRQAADVEHVKHRIREYEQGKTEFSSEDDPHVIADCVKYVIREMPSSPIPASCCKALLEACRTKRAARVNAVRVAVMDTFPEPNRRLLQRILIMMQKVASHKAVNLMSPSAVAACMAPLLLRPLLAGECNIENDFDVGGDGSQQLLQAAAAANHAQAIVITLLEEYDKIFGERSVSTDLYSDSDEEATEDDESYEDDESDEDDEYDDASVRSEYDDDDDVASGTGSESDHSIRIVSDDDKDSGYSTSVSESSEADDNLKATKKSSSSLHDSLPENVGSSWSEDKQSSNNSTKKSFKSAELSKDVCGETKLEDKRTSAKLFSWIPKSTSIGRPGHVARHNHLGRTGAKKNVSMESIDFPCEEEEEIEILKAQKADLQNKLTEEVEGNAILEARLEERKRTLHDHCLALEKDVTRLENELQKEKDKKMALEAALNLSQAPISPLPTIDEKISADLKDSAQAEADVTISNKKVDNLGLQHNEHLEDNSDSCDNNQPNHQEKMIDKPKHTQRSLGRSRSKEQDRNTDDADPRRVKKQAQRQGLFGRSVSIGVGAASSSKKSAAKSDVANSTSSTLTRLTNRLNFRKERKTQTANEVEDMESANANANANAGGVSSSDKGKGSESAQNPAEKGGEPDVITQ